MTKRLSSMKVIGLPNKEDSDEDVRDKYAKQLMETAAKDTSQTNRLQQLKSSLHSIDEVGENPPAHQKNTVIFGKAPARPIPVVLEPASDPREMMVGME